MKAEPIQQIKISISDALTTSSQVHLLWQAFLKPRAASIDML